MALITVETARSMAAQAVAKRKILSIERRTKDALLAELVAEKAIKPVQPEPEPEPLPDFSEPLTRAFNEKLTALIESDDPKAIAALARALRDLRETYHLVTGEARPGIKKHDGRPKRQVSPVEPQPAEPVPAPISPPNPSNPQ